MARQQPSSPCVNCGKSNVWYEPECRHCGLNLWTNTFEPFCDFMTRWLGDCKCWRHEPPPKPKKPKPEPPPPPPMQKYPPRRVTQK